MSKGPLIRWGKLLIIRSRKRHNRFYGRNVLTTPLGLTLVQTPSRNSRSICRCMYVYREQRKPKICLDVQPKVYVTTSTRHLSKTTVRSRGVNDERCWRQGETERDPLNTPGGRRSRTEGSDRLKSPLKYDV